MSKVPRLVALFTLAVTLVTRPATAAGQPVPVVLNGDTVIYTAARPGDPLDRAVRALARDLERVVGGHPSVRPLADVGATPGLVVVGPGDAAVAPTVAGPESHHLYVGTVGGHRQLVLEGADLRGQIYAVYTLSERVLGVPPFWYYCGWTPDRRNEITVPADFDVAVASPQVRYRAWFPNDTDLFAPWRRLSADNDQMWLEAALRLKLNTIEWFDGTRDYSVPYAVSPTTKLIADYGLINTTHHHSPLNASLGGWADYWQTVRHVKPPTLSLANEKALEEFWQYNVDCVVRNHIDMLWVIGFRGQGDHPFWNTFKDAPASMADRGAVIGRMMRKQRDLVLAATDKPDVQFRTIFYDELSDLLAAGDLHPPEDPSLIWTYVAARRDHYPNADVQQLPDASDRRLGYYFNYQFTSTGSHLAAAEGPWKMEANLRYVAAKSRRPLAFSVVNAGNIREYVMELSANAAMLWDFDAYSSDRFLTAYCATYFGPTHAGRAAALYRAYYDAYWRQRRPDLPGFDRQYLFQDLRYQRAILSLCRAFDQPFDPNPLHDLAAEQAKGRTFRIVPEDNGATTQVAAILNGTARSAAAFERVVKDAEALSADLQGGPQTFFNDSVRQPAAYLLGLNQCLSELTTAYAATDPADRRAKARAAAAALGRAEQALRATQHGVFATWYAGDKVFGFKAVRQAVDRLAVDK